MSEILNINVRQYPSEDGRTILTTAVLVLGKIGDYAVYVGHGSPEFVARFGNKLSFKEASCQFFPLEEERYRV